MLLHACKQTFRIIKVRISQKVKGAIMQNLSCNIFNSEAVVRRCSVEKVFLEILQNFHACISVPLLMFNMNFIRETVLA